MQMEKEQEDNVPDQLDRSRMFHFCCHHAIRSGLRLIAPCLALLLALSLLGTQLDAGSAVITDRYVKDRRALMQGQKAALTTLSDMVAGRTLFDARLAKAARRDLISSTGRIAKRFRKHRMEPNSHARPEIWTQWQDFGQRADTARLTAKQINSRSLAGLRRSLPAMMQACQSCHQSYRRYPNRAITH